MIYKVYTATLNVVSTFTEPGLKYATSFGGMHFDNGDFIVSCRKKVVTDPEGRYDEYQKTLMKFDKNLNKLWETSFGGYGVPGIWDVALSHDNQIVGISYELEDQMSKACLFKFDTTGTQLWQRNYFVLSTPNEYWAVNNAYSFDLMNDGGYVLGGHSKIFFPDKEVGWVMRVNCLGFLGPPQAALTHDYLENYQINFTNNSTEAGSFTWIFDDGAIYHTTEHDGDIQHTFEHLEVPHTVILIAHGCNGEADTLRYVIPVHPDFIPAEPNPEIIIPENGYFAIYPNPSAVGNPIYAVINEQPNAQTLALEFHDASGKLAARYNLSTEGGIVFLHNDFAQGLYHVSLIVDGKIKARKKFVVQG
jgi:hypothetical protein